MPRETNADLLARIDERTKNMEEQLATACVVLLGNGHPEHGLAARFDKHVSEPHLWKLSRSKTFWGIMLAMLVIVNVGIQFSHPWILMLGKFLGVSVTP